MTSKWSEQIKDVVVGARQQLAVGGPVRAGRIASIINVGIVTLLAVDAVIVGFWYVIAGAVNVLVTGFTAGFLASRWPR